MTPQKLKTQISHFTFSEEPTSIIKEIRNFLAGRAVGITRDEALLEEVLKILFCISNFPFTQVSNSEIETAKIIRGEFSKIKSKLSEFYLPDEEILLDPQSIHFVVMGLSKLLGGEKKKIDVVASLYQAFIGNHVRGQEGQFFTPKVAVEFLVQAVNVKSDWKIIDTACGACSFLTESYLQLNKENNNDSEVKNFAKNNLFGIEKDTELTRLAKIHLAILTGEVGNIYNADSLLMREGNLPKVKDATFDLVITNPPFGSKIKSADEETSAKYELGYKWEKVNDEYLKTDRLNLNTPPQVLFTERNVRALKEGGILASVIPESLFSNKNYKNVVQYLLKNTEIQAVIGMPESLFKTSGKGGTHTKTCLLIARKTSKPNKNNKIFLAEAKWCGHDSRGNTIPKNDLPDILDNYLKFLKGNYKEHSHLGYVIKSSQIEDYILAPRYYNIDVENSKDKIAETSELVTINDLLKKKILEFSTGDEVGKLAYGSGDIPYIRTSDLTNWEIKLDAKHRVDRSIYEKIKHKQDIQEGDLLMVKDGTYLIGTVAIVTKEDVEMIYQSHIYKIRVQKNNLGLTPYNLLVLLSSSFVQKQIKSKQLTQDIIDSLGKRVYDILLPLPRNKALLAKMHEEGLSIINYKMKAKKATQEIINKINLSFAL